MLISELDPIAISLQETFQKADKLPNFSNYSYYSIPAQEARGTAHGGVAILIKNSTPHQHIQLNTSLQAVAVRITLHKTVTVCSLYLSPSSKYSNADLEDFIDQLPPPVLILGDFNAHSSLWGCTKTGIRGKLVEDLLLKQNLSLLNDGSHTYLHPATGSCSAIDLSISDPSLYLDLTWSVHSDQHGSDHYPIVIHTPSPSCAVTNCTWKLAKADWSCFSDRASSELGLLNTEDLENPVESFTNILADIANSTIPRSKPRHKKNNTLYYNEECRAATRNRRKALQKVKVSPTSENIENKK